MNFDNYNSVTTLYFSQAEKLGEKSHLWKKVNDKYVSLSWNETKKQINAISSGLINQGVKKGDRIFICSENRPEFFISDMAIMSAGAISVPAYTTNTSSDHEYILNHSGAKGIIVSTMDIANKILSKITNCPQCEFIIVIDYKNIENDSKIRNQFCINFNFISFSTFHC